MYFLAHGSLTGNLNIFRANSVGVELCNLRQVANSLAKVKAFLKSLNWPLNKSVYA